LGIKKPPNKPGSKANNEKGIIRAPEFGCGKKKDLNNGKDKSHLQIQAY